MKLKSISIFFPFYNDEHTIKTIVLETLHLIKQISDDYEIILVNDGSKDNTKSIALELVKKYPEIILIDHQENNGYGASLISGFKAAKKDWVFYTDGDAQYDIKELKRLIKFTDKGDMINGYRLKREDPLIRRICGKIYATTAKILYGIKIKDVTCDFRLIKKKCLDKIKLTAKSGFICVELIKKLQNINATSVEVPVHHFPRIYGKSESFKLKKIYEQIKDLFTNINKI